MDATVTQNNWDLVDLSITIHLRTGRMVQFDRETLTRHEAMKSRAAMSQIGVNPGNLQGQVTIGGYGGSTTVTRFIHMDAIEYVDVAIYEKD